MRTNIVLDEGLINEAFKFAPAPVHTKRDLVMLALKEFVENHKRRDLRNLRGKVKLDEQYNYKTLRENTEDEADH